MDVEQLVVSIGLDPAAFRQGLANVRAGLQQVETGLQQFGAGLQGAGRGAEQAGARGGAALGQMAAKTREVGNAANQMGARLRSLTDSWAANVKGFVAGIAGPLLGMFAVGSITGGYMSDIAKVAEQTGAYSAKLEEQRKKKELLNRVTKQDVELYVKGREALSKFEYAARGVGNELMRSFGGGLSFVVEKLQGLAEWVRRNEGNIVRFLQVTAGTLTAVLLPAIVRVTAAMLANPITWIIAAIVGLIIVIDDLVTYIQGGESAFSDLWAIFGTGPEIAEKLRNAWETLKAAGIALWDGVRAAATAFFSNFGGAFEAARQAFLSFIQFIRNLFSGNFRQAGEDLRNVFARVLEAIKGLFTGWINTIRDAIRGLLDMLPSLDGIKEGASRAWEGLKDFGRGLFGGGEETAAQGAPQAPTLAAAHQVIPSGTALNAAAVPAQITHNEPHETTVTTTLNGGVNVYTQATDAQGIAAAAGGAMRGELGKTGAFAADTGVRQ